MADVVFSDEEYAHLTEVVGSLMIGQFGGDQEAYRSAITAIFSTFAFDDEEDMQGPPGTSTPGDNSEVMEEE